MRKKLFCFIGVMVLILIGVTCLSACNNEKKIYFSFQSAPEHTTVNTSNCNQDKDGKTYVHANEELSVYVNVDDGYYSDDFKLYINSQEVNITPQTNDAGTIVYSYEYKFTPTEDFEVSYSGSFKIIKKVLTIVKEDGTQNDGAEAFNRDFPQNSEVFVRFGENNILGFPSTERTYADFVTFNTIQKSLSYGQTFDFYVYTKGFKGEPGIFDLYNTTTPNVLLNLKEEFYHDGDKIGYHYTYTQTYYSGNLIFKNASLNIISQISTSETSATQNAKVGSEKLVMEIAKDLSTLTITINNYNTLAQSVKDSFANLKLTINNVLQNVDFTQDDDGVFTITFNKPYEYVAEDGDIYHPFFYYVNLNFYTLEYFEGEQLQPMEQD